MRDFAWGATQSFKPLHKICDFDLMFDAHIRDGHLHCTESFLDTFHPFVLTQCRQPLSDGLEQRAGCDLRCVRGTVKVLNGHAA